MAHGFLSYQDTRGEADQLRNAKDLFDGLNWLRKQFRKDLRVVNANVKEIRDTAQLPQGKTPLLKGGNDPALPPSSPLQKMLGGTALQRSLPGGAVATNPEVMGGPLARGMGFGGSPLKAEGFVGDKIVDIGATNLGVERDLGGDDMFVKRLNTIDDGVGGGSTEVVQAIDRLTFVTMSLVAATKEQTQQQGMIAAAQQQQSEKLARQAKAAAEENALEMGGDLSGNLAYQKSLLASGAGMMGGGGRGGGPGMGIGGKVLAKNILKSATKRGAARTGTRLGAALGGKMLGGLGARMGAKIGAKSAGKVAGSAIAKSLGKKIPLVGLGLGAVFAAQRAMQGDFLGAGLELASGAASTVPGIGTAASVGIDAGLAARDMMTPFAKGGIVSEPTNALIGEAGKEGVFPLSGSEGKKTFIKFGEGILEAQRKNKTEYGKLQAEGFKTYYEKQNGWEKWWTGFKEFLSKLPVIGDLFKDKDDPKNNTPEGRVGDAIDDIAGNVSPETTKEFASVLPEGRPVMNDGFGDRGGRHQGIDVGVDGGSKVTAVEGGEVVDIYPNYGKHGDAVVIEHADGTRNIYGHVDPSVAIGDKVEAGDTIARVKYWPTAKGDNTHLHMERVGTSGKKVDPAAYLNQRALDQAAVDNERIASEAEQKSFRTAAGEASALLNDEKSAGKGGLVRIPGVGTVQRGKDWFGGHQMKFFKPDGTQINAEEFNKLLEAESQRLGISGSMPDFDAGVPMTKPGEGDQSSISPSAADNGDTLSIASSQEVASAAVASRQSPIIQNFYGSDGKQSGGNQPASVPFGISGRDTGTSAFSELSLRTIG
jgi:murein DD-endopeptidase MepM/ murein hydrolase activator NlpD